MESLVTLTTSEEYINYSALVWVSMWFGACKPSVFEIVRVALQFVMVFVKHVEKLSQVLGMIGDTKKIYQVCPRVSIINGASQK